MASGSGGSAAPEAVAAEGPASGGPVTVGVACGGSGRAKVSGRSLGSTSSASLSGKGSRATPPQQSAEMTWANYVPTTGQEAPTRYYFIGDYADEQEAEPLNVEHATATGSDDPAPIIQSDPPALPTRWWAHWSERRERNYYSHPVTAQTVWRIPKGDTVAPLHEAHFHLRGSARIAIQQALERRQQCAPYPIEPPQEDPLPAEWQMAWGSSSTTLSMVKYSGTDQT